MPSWRNMLTSQREDGQATAASFSRPLPAGIHRYFEQAELTSKLQLLERGVFLNLVVCTVKKNTD
eukprot:scaffold35894_cov250-Skeletonema_dohrnii-CCMP3373.AAC.1